MRRLRVVRVYKSVNATGGVHRRLVELLPKLAERVDLRMLCYRGRGSAASELEAAGIPVDVVELGAKWAPWTTRRYVDYFRRHAPDIVHTHEYTANTFAISAAAAAGVPVRVRHLHTMDPWGDTAGIRRWMRVVADRRASRRAQLTLAVSEAVRQRYLQVTGLPAASCGVLYNGVDLQRFERGDDAGALVRQEWGIPREALLVGTLGRLGRGKGHEDFLEAAAHLSAELPSTRFALVGGGGSRSELEARTAALGLEGRVVFAGHRDDVEAALSAMDLFLFTSPSEGFGTAVVEAMAAGLPVVAYRLPSLIEILGDSGAGELVPPQDPRAAAAAAKKYLSNPDARGVAGRRARERARCFSLDAVVESTLRLYEALAEGRVDRGRAGEQP